ncbi:mitochondrial ribosomal protein S7, partial [Volvox carteri f. nagariensis]
DVVHVVMRAVENCKPLMKIQQNKAGNKVLLVPKPLDPAQSTNFAIKWIVQAAQKRRDNGRGRVPMADCLAAELLLAYQRKGSARTRRDEIHKLALDNRANVRARWW